MIFFGAATFLLVVYSLPLFLRRVRQERRGEAVDVFSPELFLCGFSLLQVPYLYLLGADRNLHASFELRVTPWIGDLEVTVVCYALLVAAAFLATLAGVRSRWAGWLAARLPRLHAARFTPRRVRTAWIVGGSVGVLVYLYFVNSIGGLLFLWAHLYLRTTLTQGMGYVFSVYTILLTATAGMVVYALRDRPGRWRAALAVVVVLAMAVLMGSLGGRSPAVAVIVLVVLTHHYCVRRRRRLLTPLTAFLGVVVVAFMAIAPLFRRAGSLERYSASPTLVAADALEGLAAMAPDVSGFDRVAVMINYFTPENIWWGRSYIDLLAAPIPRSMYPRKPPVDDGVYFQEILYGRRVKPSLPAREMRPTSFPMGTYVTYMNFWIPGFLLASFLVGVGMGAFYRYMALTDHAPHAVFFYQFAMMGGIQFSVYGIMLMTMTFAIGAGYFWFFFARKWAGPLPRPSSAPALGGAS